MGIDAEGFGIGREKAFGDEILEDGGVVVYRLAPFLGRPEILELKIAGAGDDGGGSSPYGGTTAEHNVIGEKAEVFGAA